jgi:hypothetical protein
VTLAIGHCRWFSRLQKKFVQGMFNPGPVARLRSKPIQPRPASGLIYPRELNLYAPTKAHVVPAKYAGPGLASQARRKLDIPDITLPRCF